MKSLLVTSLFAIGAIAFSACGSSNTKHNSSEEAQTTESTEEVTAGQTPSEIKSIVVDVRSQKEWDNDGHAPCTKLIPLPELESRVNELKGYNKVTFVCRSGGRAGRAKQFLEGQGFTNVENAGPWQNAPCK
ncbi:MAG: rhodanese-like domain-containing protein [Bacteroidia bacterium]|jgi:phage shock protein E|nr:rhodanese-like domain-containing protein [Bacteroidia bacterium]